MLGLKIPPGRLVFVAAIFLLLLLGIYSLISGYTLLSIANERKKWSMVTGTVIRSVVIGERAYRANIVYSYSFQNALHTDSSSLDPASFGTRAARLQKAEVESALYHPGDTVHVFVDPVNPAHSTLHPGVTWAAYAQTGTGIFFVLGALITLGWLMRHPLSTVPRSS